jgi:hypothetical protein
LYRNNRRGNPGANIVAFIAVLFIGGGILWLFLQPASTPNSTVPPDSTPGAGVVQVPGTTAATTTSAAQTTAALITATLNNPPLTPTIAPPTPVPVTPTASASLTPTASVQVSPSPARPVTPTTTSGSGLRPCNFEQDRLPAYLKAEHLSALQPAFRQAAKLPAAPTLYQMDLVVNPVQFTYSGEVTITFWNKAPYPMNTIMLRAYPDFFRSLGGELLVTNARVDGRAAELDDRSQTYVEVIPARAIPACSQVSLSVRFSGKIVRQLNANAYAVGTFYAGQGSFALGTFYPQLGVWQTVATNTGERWEWSVTPMRASSDLTAAEVAFYDVNIIAPQTYELYGSGVTAEPRVRPAANQTGQKATRMVGGPMREFAVVGSETFDPQTLTAQTTNGVTVTVVTVRADGATKTQQDTFARKARDITVASLDEYSALLAPYPYRTYTLVQSPLAGFNGIEWPMFSQYSFELFRSNYAGVEQEYGGLAYSKPGTLVVVHEVLHQWWYNLVGNDQQLEPFIDEGLTEYTTYLLPELVAKRLGTPPDAAKRFADSWLDKLKTRLEREDLPAFGDLKVNTPAQGVDLQQAGMLFYRKAPLFYRAFREKFGDDVFFNFLRTYFAKYQYKVVRYNDLIQTLLEAVPPARAAEATEFINSWLNEKNVQRDLKP